MLSLPQFPSLHLERSAGAVVVWASRLQPEAERAPCKLEKAGNPLLICASRLMADRQLAEATSPLDDKETECPETGTVCLTKSCTSAVQHSGARTCYTHTHTHTHATHTHPPHTLGDPTRKQAASLSVATPSSDCPPATHPAPQGRCCKHRAVFSYWRENTFHISEETATVPSKPNPTMLRPRRLPASFLLLTAPLPFLGT